jgi:hypothetical protein
LNINYLRLNKIPKNFIEYLYTLHLTLMLHLRTSSAIIALLFSALPILAQESPHFSTGNEIAYKVFTGGQFGFNLGNSTSIELSPILGYYTCPYFSFGAGCGYQYYRYRYPFSNQSEHINIYSARVFTRIHPVNFLFAHAEFEHLRYRNNAAIFPHLPHDEIITAQGILLGAGYMEMISDYFGSYIMLLWNFNETPNTPYANPIIRFGVEIGL